jgi:hypothetical protein
MMYVIQKNETQGKPDGKPLWLSRAAPSMIWGDKRHAMFFETRALAQMVANKSIARDETAEIVFVQDTTRWRE